MSSIVINDICPSFGSIEPTEIKALCVSNVSNSKNDSNSKFKNSSKSSGGSSNLNKFLLNSEISSNLQKLIDTLFEIFEDIQKILSPKISSKDDLSNENLEDSDRIRIIRNMVDEIRKLKSSYNLKDETIQLSFNNVRIVEKSPEFSKIKNLEDKRNTQSNLSNNTFFLKRYIENKCSKSSNNNYNNINIDKSFSLIENQKYNLNNTFEYFN